MTDRSKRMLDLFESCHGPLHIQGWGVKLRRRFGYFTPDEYYEETLDRVIDDRTVWLDVGGGKSIFPGNPALSEGLARRCQHLMVVDPSSNIQLNPYAHERFQGLLESIPDTARFSVATARMVVEHVEDPKAFVAKLGRVVLPGGLVVLYTVSRWSPVTILSGLTPTWVHHRAKQLLWKTDESDTFPVAYLMNTRRRLKMLFSANGFSCLEFYRLDDCRTLARWKSTFVAELLFWKLLRLIRLGYPEACLIGVFQKG